MNEGQIEGIGDAQDGGSSHGRRLTPNDTSSASFLASACSLAVGKGFDCYRLLRGFRRLDPATDELAIRDILREFELWAIAHGVAGVKEVMKEFENGERDGDVAVIYGKSGTGDRVCICVEDAETCWVATEEVVGKEFLFRVYKNEAVTDGGDGWDTLDRHGERLEGIDETIQGLGRALALHGDTVEGKIASGGKWFMKGELWDWEFDFGEEKVK